jgi:hypothetical protein
MTQNNLGIALVSLGERESGPARLEEAVLALREALKERTRERVPLQWAATRKSLEIMLRFLDERKRRTGSEPHDIR